MHSYSVLGAVRPSQINNDYVYLIPLIRSLPGPQSTIILNRPVLIWVKLLSVGLNHYVIGLSYVEIDLNLG